jgi:hypothetical protein
VPVSRARWWLAGAAVLVLFAVYLWGGYAAHWGWTGLSGDVALWDWLEALALPVTVVLVPVLLQRRSRLSGRVRAVALALLVGFTVLVLAGYLVPWEWTGFTGNTLWDWLELALLPLVLSTATLWPGRDQMRTTHWALVAAGLTAFVVVVLAGYLVPWSWTGFSDNKAWDWLKLLALPVLLPTVVLPALGRYLDRLSSPETPGAAAPESPHR